MSIVPFQNTGKHFPSGLPEIDLDGEEERRTIGAFANLPVIEVAEKPTICPSCGALVNPLTDACRC